MLTLASAAGSITWVAMREVLSTLDDEPAVQHAHPAGEVDNPRLLGRQLDRRLLEGREKSTDAEIGDHDLLRAAGGLLAVEDQAHGSAPLHLHLGRRVAGLDGDGDFLRAARAGRGRGGGAAGQEEVP